MAAPKFNRYALGNTGGRPPHYETPEQLEAKCSEYFELVTTASGITKAGVDGLTYHVGFKSRASWADYEKRSEEFSYIVHRVKLFVISCHEYNLHGFNWAGSAFALKNMNPAEWRDETFVTQPVSKVEIVEKSTRDAT